ncbi:AP endonuclease 2, partial [Tremellales sp. Uapishka_1]
MRILTWNVNVLRTCMDYHPFSKMEKKNIEGLLDELQADILCFQEHKTRRAILEKTMACPGRYDAFWTFPRSKTGYSGVCTYVNSDLCVPLKAEEGITGLLLSDKSSTMKPPWTPEERIGCYPDIDPSLMTDEVDGSSFDMKKLDIEGRAVVVDFGLFILFNLYSPNETNETRYPYKMNFLHVLQKRVQLLMDAGREVIIAGDINIMRAPIDSGEGGIRTSAEQHYEHPARRIFDNWIAPKGPMVDVVRESWPDRDDMYTCWNTKLDARPSNYGSRIDYILCSPGLRPWIKGGDIQPKTFGSDHCPVYIDLHDSITDATDGEILLKDMLNPANRPASTGLVYPGDAKRREGIPEPPRFATKFYEEFSGRQTTLKGFFGGGSQVKRKTATAKSETPSTPSPIIEDDRRRTPPPTFDSVAGPLSLAKAAFAAIDAPTADSSTSIELSQPVSSPKPLIASEPHRPSQSPRPSESSRLSQRSPSLQPSRRTPSSSAPIDMTFDESPRRPSISAKHSSESKSKSKKSTPAPGSQTKLSSFFAPPPSAKRQTSPTPPPPRPKRKSTPSSCPLPASSTEEEDLLFAQSLAEAETSRAEAIAEKNSQAAPVWSNLFAKKLPPLCSVHHKPCRIFYSSLRASEVIKECYRSCPHNMNDLNTLAAALEHVRCISKTVLENMDSSTADFHQAALDSERPLKCLETRSDHLVERGAMTVEGARFDAQTKLMVEDARDLKHLSDLTTGFPNLSSYVVDDDKTTVLQEAISFVSNPSQSGSSPVTRDQLKGLRRYMGRCLAHDDNSITRMKCDQILNDHAKLRYQYEVARSALEAADLDERSSHREARPWVSIPCTLM